MQIIPAEPGWYTRWDTEQTNSHGDTIYRYTRVIAWAIKEYPGVGPLLTPMTPFDSPYGESSPNQFVIFVPECTQAVFTSINDYSQEGIE